MAEKDITEKNLESYDDVFADIINGLLFKGENIVKETDLQEAIPMSQYKIDGRMHEQERDVAKFWMNGTIRLCLYGFENQTAVDRAMPLRIISYDGANYRGQLLRSGDDCPRNFYPAVTIVLYFGEKPWTHKNLLECLEIPPNLKDYVSNYRINVFEIARLSPRKVKLFKSDFKIVADYFVQRRRNKRYVPSKDTIRHVDGVLKLMSVLTGDTRYEAIQQEYRQNGRQGDNTMCEVLTQWHDTGFNKGLKQGKVEGLKQGKIEGLKQGKVEGKIETAKRMLKLNYPINVVSEITQLSAKELDKLQKEILESQ